MKIARSLLLFLAGIALTFLQAGCSSLPLSGKLPEGLSVEQLTSVDDNAVMAISPDGTVVALTSSGLKLYHIPNRQLLEVTGQTPRRIAWSPNGYSLAATYADSGKSVIHTYDQHGIRVAETAIDGEITDISWLSEAELLTASVEVKSYKFGSNFNSVIHRWQPGRDAPKRIDLKNTTLQPANASRWSTTLSRGPMIDVSRTADQILYLHPVDPPLFTPYLKLILRDLASSKEMEIGPVNLGSHGGRFTADGENVIYGDGIGKVTRYNPWTGETVATLKSAGKELEISPAGDYIFADGALFHGTDMLAMLAPGGTARFTPNGSQLLVAAKGDLYLLSGLHPANEKLLPLQQLEKLLQPRAWRLDNLISARDYKDALEKTRRLK